MFKDDDELLDIDDNNENEKSPEVVESASAYLVTTVDNEVNNVQVREPGKKSGHAKNSKKQLKVPNLRPRLNPRIFYFDDFQG